MKLTFKEIHVLIQHHKMQAFEFSNLQEKYSKEGKFDGAMEAQHSKNAHKGRIKKLEKHLKKLTKG